MVAFNCDFKLKSNLRSAESDRRLQIRRRQIEAAPNALQSRAVGRAGEVLQQDALPGYLHEGGAGTADRPHRVQGSGRKGKVNS